MPDSTLADLSKKMGEAHEKVVETHEAMKKINDRIIAVEEKQGHVPADLKETLGQVQTALTASDEKHVKLKESFDAMDKKLSGLNAIADEAEEKGDLKEHELKFIGMMRKGITNPEHEEKLIELQKKTMFAASDPDGGYVIPRAIAKRIVKTIEETSPVRSLATVVKVGGEDYRYMIDIGTGNGGWVAERDERPNTGTPKMQQGTIVAHEMYANPCVTQKMLDDAAFDIVGWLNGKTATKFSRMEATAFLLGDGIGKPRGILTHSDGTTWGKIERIQTGDASEITPDSLILLQNALKAEYGARAHFAMRRQTVGKIRVLKDNNGQYLWQPGLKSGEAATLLGDPISRMADMPAVAANSLPVLYGDFKETYTIVDRQAIRILRDPYSNKPFVEFYTTRRVGGEVTNFESMKILEVKA